MKQCTCCQEVKPLDLFAYAYRRDGSRRPHTYCKACRSRQQVAARRRKNGRQGTEWLLPEMTLSQQLDCVRFRKWAAPVFNRGLLTWRFA